jgi:hypothetical protein
MFEKSIQPAIAIPPGKHAARQLADLTARKRVHLKVDGQ